MTCEVLQLHGRDHMASGKKSQENEGMKLGIVWSGEQTAEDNCNGGHLDNVENVV